MGIFKQPKAPDPWATAAAQSAANREAAIASSELSMINQVTPDGNLTYDWIGTTPAGNSRYQVTQTLNPTQQAAKTAEQEVDRDTNLLAKSLLGKVQGTVSTPTDYSEAAIKARTDAMINPRVAARFAQDEDKLRTALINRGVREGSQAFRDAFQAHDQAKNDAFIQEGLSSRQQAIQEMGLPQRDAINNIGALLGTGQVSAPQFVTTPRAQVAAPDISGMIYQNYGQRVANNNAAMGGLFGLLGSGAQAAAKISDARTKTDIRRIGAADNGLPIYLYRYRFGGPFEIGLMAQDVEKVKPEAVIDRADGFKAVDYAMAMEA